MIRKGDRLVCEVWPMGPSNITAIVVALEVVEARMRVLGGATIVGIPLGVIAMVIFP